MEIKQQLIDYRNTHKESRVLMSAVLGELDRISKTPTNEQCISTIKKMIESNIECNNQEENKILELFMPQQLTAVEIAVILNEQNFPTLGDCMKWFKQNKAGLYDGRAVTELYKNLELWQN